MSKARPNHFGLGSSDCLSKKSTFLQSDFFRLSALLVLAFFPWADLLAQPQSACDSLQVAWRCYYDDADFDRADKLVADCDEVSALELRGYIACKRENWEEAKEIICLLLKQRRDYVHVQTPVAEGFDALVEELRNKCADKPPPPPSSHDPRRLFLLPDANVLESLEANLGVGTDLFNSDVPEENPLPPFLWHVGFGLGGVAEFELSSIEVINRLEGKGKPWLITGSLKFGLSEGRLLEGMPAIAVFAQRSASWLHKDKEGSFEYKKSFTRFQFLASKTFGPVRVQGGIGGIVPGLSVYDINTKRHIAFPGVNADEEADSTVHKWRPSGGAGLQWRANSRVSLIVEFNNLPKYDFELADASNKELPQDSVKMVLTKQEVWLAGVRFSITRTALFDAGLLWRNTGNVARDLEQESPISFWLRFNLGFSSKRWFEQSEGQ